jgi:hypothetical protein
MFAYSGRGTRLGAYAEPWDAPSITGQLQVMTTGELRFSVPGVNFLLDYRGDPATRAAFEKYSFGSDVTIYGKKAAYGIYLVESWSAPSAPGGNGAGGNGAGDDGAGNGAGGGGGDGGGGTDGSGPTTPGAGTGTTPASGAAIPWGPILAAGLGILFLSRPSR